MTTDLRPADFVLAPYARSSNWRGAYQILSAVGPYLACWALAIHLAQRAPWAVPLLVIPLVLFSLRCFSLMHDCGHHSLFHSRWLNRVGGFILGLVNAIPQLAWSNDHAFHHRTNGDWERYRGVTDLITTDDYAQLSARQQATYALLRHPLMALPGGFYYLAIQPRLALLKEISRAVRAQAVPRSAEFWDLLLNNVVLIALVVAAGQRWGFGLVLGLYGVTLTFSAALFLWIFFVQHIFEGSYAHNTEGWSHMQGALEGTSYLQMPALLRWFTADIGYHNIHHLSERIPNYNLRAAHQANARLLAAVPCLRLGDMLSCAQFKLWDRETERLVPCPEQVDAVA
ncbi:fatty acid desaturase [Cyanobium sp. LEGE 06143]|uniref:fatty acid desaturase n=1 Tax=Cyanobium sp. LEGE 06143 TaxID=945727 RepID=UPI00187F8CA3|nr:fatty acid desaturase [Cyanobium sp. LEGE 06143]MBE9171653.1 fatty acid desaturase [Cyanobium sp. LEGE 06143]